MPAFTYDMLSRTIEWVCSTLARMVYKSKSQDGNYGVITMDDELYDSIIFRNALDECIAVWNTNNENFKAIWTGKKTNAGTNVTIRIYFTPNDKSKKVTIINPGTVLGNTTKWSINIPQQ